MATLSTSDLSTDDIRTILSAGVGALTLQQLCQHVNVDPLGLDPNYVSGGGVTARYTNLRTVPFEQGDFRGYSDPNWRIFVQDYDGVSVARTVFGEDLHPSKYWSFGFDYYTGSAYTTQIFNQTTRICYTKDILDYATDFGAINATWTGPYTVGSPGWYARFEDEVWSIPFGTHAYTTSLAAGSYWWVLSTGANYYFLSDDYGEGSYLYFPITIYEYIIGDPEEFLSFSAAGGADSFEVWTGLFTTCTVIAGTVTLTGGTTGTGNRTQTFNVPINLTGSPVIHTIEITGAGASDSEITIYQNA